MRKNNERKVLKVDFEVWCNLVADLSKELNKEYYEVEGMLAEILKNEGIEDVNMVTRTKEAIIEIMNVPLNKACTMYNVQAFKNEYKEKLEKVL